MLDNKTKSINLIIKLKIIVENKAYHKWKRGEMFIEENQIIWLEKIYKFLGLLYSFICYCWLYDCL